MSDLLSFNLSRHLGKNRDRLVALWGRHGNVGENRVVGSESVGKYDKKII